MFKYLCFFLLLLTGASCTSVKEQLAEQLTAALEKNPCLEEQEYTNAKALIEDYPEDFRTLVDSSKKMSHYAFTAYLSTLANNLGIALDTSCCWTPEEFVQKPAPFNVNVFIENSASMDGYVKENEATSFENTILDLLNTLNRSTSCDSLNIAYINNEIRNPISNASASEIGTFAGNLEPDDFRKHGGNRGQSDLHEIMNAVIQKVDEQNAVVIITDCVYSPGKNHPDASAYLEQQQHALNNTFSLRLQEQQMCFFMLQLRSPFYGSYYDRFNDKHALNGGLRPYYILIAATPAQLATLHREKLFNKLEGIENQLVFEPATAGEEAAVIITRYKPTGMYVSDNKVRPRAVRDAVASTDPKTEKQFSFTAGVTFRKLFAPREFIADTSNYFLSNPEYTLTILPEKEVNDAAQLKGYDYGMRLSTRHLVSEQLNIQLRSKIPSWVLQYSSDDDTNIRRDSAEQTRTFGLKYFVGGIYEAYCEHNNPSVNSANPYYILEQFTISIQPEK